VAKRSAVPSLLPYLQGGRSSLYLKFSLDTTIQAAQKGNARFPFQILDRSEPLARIVDGEVITDAGNRIERVSVLLQDDQYRLAQDALWPHTNIDIERCWQRAFSFFKSETQGDGVATFAPQIDDQGELTPLQSLFFCSAKQVFFHPPCPVCGAGLEQCYEDAMLDEAGLARYSQSLVRYLFCPTCKEIAGETSFYVYSHGAGSAPLVKDRRDLIAEFGNLPEGRAEGFPCSGCDSAQECYSPEQRVMSRMAPVCFYPFYMLIFPGASVKATDFLALVSGATFEELESHLAKSGRSKGMGRIEEIRPAHGDQVTFLTSEGEERFLEVLYLKLSFLGDLYGSVSPGVDQLEWPDLGLSLDRMWVRFGDQSRLLPSIWHFKVQLMGLGGQATDPGTLPKAPPAFGYYFMGLSWFYALLVNKQQGMSQVHDAVARVVEASVAEGGGDIEPRDIRGDDVFAPERIFWDGRPGFGAEVDGDTLSLWKASLDLGFDLIGVAMNQGAWSDQVFWDTWKGLTERIKSGLFQRAEGVEPVRPAATEGNAPDAERRDVDDDGVLSEIVLNIAAKWREASVEGGRAESTVPGSPPGEDVDLAETLVFAVPSEKGKSSPEETQGEDDEHVETVILSRGSFGDVSREEGSSDVRSTETEMAETVVLSAGRPAQPEPEVTERDSSGEECLTETVMMSPSTGKGDQPGDVPRSESDTGVDTGKDKLSSPKRPAQEGDALEETVILNPKRDKKK